MAATNGAVSECEAYANSVDFKDGPVLTMMNKRLRSLRKKYNRILQIEENRAQGKVINKEQEEVLKTKIAVAALIDEYEKLRQPLSAAVKEELVEREKELMAATLRRREEEESVADDKDSDRNEAERKEAGNEPSGEVRKDSDDQAPAVSNGPSGVDQLEAREAEFSQENESINGQLMEGQNQGSDHPAEAATVDLLKLLYFAHLFDVRSQREAPSLVWTKVHERSSCLSYDFVTDDSTSPLLEGDLDALSLFGSLLTSRPPNATLSHKEALQQCIQHAILWLRNSDRPIQSDPGVTYSHLKERLNRILSSEYYTMTPELQTVSQQTAAVAATAAGHYVTEVLVHKTSPGSGVVETDNLSTFYSQEVQASSEQQNSPNGEYTSLAPVEATRNVDLSDTHVSADSAPTYGTETFATAVKIPEGDVEEIADQDVAAMPEQLQQQDQITSTPQPTQQQQNQQQTDVFQSIGPRGYQGFRGRGMGYGTGGRGRGFANGRGRGGRGGYYTNGRGGQYYDQGGYYQRNYYGRGGGRGGRGGMMYNGHANGPVGATSAAGSTSS